MTCEPYLISGEDIPYLLRQIYYPPKKLWIEGKLPDDTLYLCIVGSRRHSQYARDACEWLIAGLAGYPICIVSGLAIGIDSVAHEAALSAGLPTIAFPGSGLDRNIIYPRAHRKLADRIIEAGGALISEFDLTATAQPWTFPQRNRLMAGISHAILIIEADKKSGTLITARHATEENRIVLALPGQILSPAAYGPNTLIYDGAIPVRSSDDILYALGLKVKEEQQQKLEGLAVHEELSTLEEKILSILSLEALDRDRLSQHLNIDIATLQSTLSDLEIRGILSEQHGQFILTRQKK